MGIQHHFDVEHARLYGLNEAILINHFQFWLIKNRANGKHQHDGRTWTYNSVKALAEIFPYLSPDQIRRTLEKLEKAEVLMSGYHSEDLRDRTKWYAFVNEEEFLNTECIRQKSQIPFGKSAKSLTNTDKNTDKGEPPGFATFWQAYPKKVAKPAALKAFRSITPNADTLATMLASLSACKQSEQWTKSAGQFIPNPATWLNQRRWEDETPSASGPASAFAGAI